MVIGLPGNGGLPASCTQSTDVVFTSPDAYADVSDAATKNEGLFDHLPAIQVQQFGVVAHVYATFQSRKNQNDPKPLVRGIKSFELLRSGGR
jgi:hypothetical protein